MSVDKGSVLHILVGAPLGLSPRWGFLPVAVAFGFIVFFASSSHAAQLPSAWQHVQTVQVNETGFIKMSVPLQTLDAARQNLEDLRFYSSKGSEIPFRIERPHPALRFVANGVNFQVRVEETFTVATFETGTTRPLNRITLVTPAVEFIKACTLEGSSDGQIWETILQSVPVFRQRDRASRLYLAFPSCAWAHLRIRLEDSRTAPIPLTAAQVHAAADDPETAEPLDLQIVDKEETEEETRLTFRAGGANVTLAGIEIDAEDPLFTRQVSLIHKKVVEGEIVEDVLARGTIYRVALEGHDTASSLRLGEGVILPRGDLVLSIHNGDSPPLSIRQIRVTRRPVYVSWLAKETGLVQILSGNPNCAFPRYDLSALPADIDAELVSSLESSPLQTNPNWRPTEPLPEVPAGSAPIDLTEWRYCKRVDISKPGVQQVELDLEISSRAKPSLQDIRVIQNGRQVPFLVERTSIMRSLTPSVERVDDPKRQNVSRWLVHLPGEILPLKRLTCEADNPFFKRSVRVLGEVSGRRGKVHNVILGAATWVRTPDEKKSKLEIPLTPASTDKLVLEVEEGNNPPLMLKRFQVYHPIVRVIFKSSPDQETFLYYGNPKAPSPSYDLDLVASRLLSAERAKASLSEARQLRRTSWSESGALTGKAGWVFWICLIAAVIVLLSVIARLLPRKPAAKGNES